MDVATAAHERAYPGPSASTFRRALNRIKKPSTAGEINELLNRDLEQGDRPFQERDEAEWLRNSEDTAFALYWSRAHGSSSMRIVRGIVGGKFRVDAAKFVKLWWPGAELNRRRQPFQGWTLPKLSADSASVNLVFSCLDSPYFGTNWNQKRNRNSPVGGRLNVLTQGSKRDRQ